MKKEATPSEPPESSPWAEPPMDRLSIEQPRVKGALTLLALRYGTPATSRYRPSASWSISPAAWSSPMARATPGKSGSETS